MKFSESWMREWVDPKEDTESLINQLTMAGLEVDSVQPVSGSLEKVIIAEIISVDTHPNAENLKTCLVDANWGLNTRYKKMFYIIPFDPTDKALTTESRKSIFRENL